MRRYSIVEDENSPLTPWLRLGIHALTCALLPDNSQLWGPNKRLRSNFIDIVMLITGHLNLTAV